MLVYDGDCGFCTSTARWVGGARAAWQELGPDGLERLGLTVEDACGAAWWVDETGRYRGHLALGRALAAAPGPRWLMGRALLVPPLRWVGAAVYPLVARWRSHLPGGTPACRP